MQYQRLNHLNMLLNKKNKQFESNLLPPATSSLYYFLYIHL